MNETDFPPKLRPWWHPVSLAGSVFVGGYPHDKNVRRAGAIAVALAAVAIIGQSLRASASTTQELLRASEARTDRMLEAYRQDTREQIAETRRLAIAVDKLANEAITTRTTLLEKIPDARPAPQRFTPRPVEPRR